MTDLKDLCKIADRLRNGEVIEFDNSEDCEVNRHDHLLHMTLEFSPNMFGTKNFKVNFNGKIVAMSPIFPQLTIRKLIVKHKLKEKEK